MDWKTASNYNYLDELDGSQWAWEFLRRNPDYIKDYTWFIANWYELELRYGKAPDRDYNDWKKDPLSCKKSVIDDEMLPIESWMEQKWGFYKFPPDPKMNAVKTQGKIAWREQIKDAITINEDNITDYLLHDTRVGLGFDTSLPLKSQLEHAQKSLIIMQKQLRKNHPEKFCTINNHRLRWTDYLRMLDGIRTDKKQVVAMELGYSHDELEESLTEAFRLRDHDYLCLPDLPLKI